MARGRDAVEHSRRQMLRDAGEWRNSAEVFDRARNVAVGLELTEDDFSGMAAELGATRAYQQIQEKLARYLGEGAAFFYDTADRLELIARRWSKTEEEQSERLESLRSEVEGIQ